MPLSPSLTGDYSIGLAKAAQVALFADRFLWRLHHLKFLGLDARDHLVKVAASLADLLWTVRKRHERLVLLFFRSPVKQQPVNPFAVTPLQDVGVGAELALVGVKQFGAIGRARRGLEIQQLQLAVATQQ